MLYSVIYLFILMIALILCQKYVEWLKLKLHHPYFVLSLSFANLLAIATMLCLLQFCGASAGCLGNGVCRCSSCILGSSALASQTRTACFSSLININTSGQQYNMFSTWRTPSESLLLFLCNTTYLAFVAYVLQKISLIMVSWNKKFIKSDQLYILVLCGLGRKLPQTKGT